jgi:class 3 adenylate cyclase
MDTGRQNAKLAILFADISGSTAIYDRLGNEQALQLISRTLGILIQEMNKHLGTLIKTIGDEIMCTFPDAATAVKAACAMQAAINAQRPGGERPLYIRIGLHYGEVIQDGTDVFGDAVNVAARITAITRARQIMTTRAAVEALPQELRDKARELKRAELRGKDESFDMFQIQWELEDTTRTRIGLPSFRRPADTRHELMLRYRQKVVALNEKQKSVMLGRGETCDLVIYNTFASRQHARIECSFGKFLLTDHSSNGTYVRFSDNQVVQVSNQQIVLHGSGSISLGEPFSEVPTEVIEFVLQ